MIVNCRFQFMRLLLILISISLLNISIAHTTDYKNLDKLSKNNSFFDDKGSPYSIEKIQDIKTSILIIYNHGSENDLKIDPCNKKPQKGYLWKGAVVPALLKLHDQKINNLTVKIYRLCSGVKGISLKTMKKYRKELKETGSIILQDEYKNLKRQNIIINEVKKFKNLGFENIILAGYSAGAWASLNLQARFPELIKGVIAINPAFAGKKNGWQKKYPEWGKIRDKEIDILNRNKNLKAILFAHNKDKFEDIKTLSFFKNFKKINFVDYSNIKPNSCSWADVDRNMENDKGHNIPQSKCFTKYVENNEYFLKFLNKIF